jgi:hypothetical protein
MLERALDAGVPAGWVTADKVFGGSPALRGWLKIRQLPYVCAGGQVHRAAAGAVWVAGTGGPAGRARPAGGLAAYQRRPGCQGPPLVWVEPGGAGHRRAAGGVGRWLLRRRCRAPGGLAYYVCAGAAGLPLVAPGIGG